MSEPTQTTLFDVDGNAQKGQAIYDRLRSQYERLYFGQFVAIEVGSEQAYVGTTSNGAMTAARQAMPSGRFHLIRIGSKAAFRLGTLECHL